MQLYTHQRTSRDKQPIKQLRAFQRVTLQPGETKTVRLQVQATDLAHWDVTREPVGGRERHVRRDGRRVVRATSGPADLARSKGEMIPPRNLSRTTRAENFDDYSGVRLVDETKASGTRSARPRTAGG